MIEMRPVPDDVSGHREVREREVASVLREDAIGPSTYINPMEYRR